MNRPVSLAALAAAVLVATGCAATPPAASPPQSSPSAAPNVAPQVPETGESAPAAVFDGDCAKVLTNEQLETIFGAQAVALPYELTSRPDGVLVQQLGGVRCLWRGGDENAAFDYYLDSAALPASALGSETIASEPCSLIAGVEVRCEIAVDANGVLLSTLLGLPEDTKISAAESFAAQLAETFEANSATQTGYLAPIQADTAWPLDFSCDDLGVDVPELLGVDSLEPTPELFETYETPVERVLWGDRQALGCSWVGRGGNSGFVVQIVALGGAAWAADQDRPVYPVDGVDSVYLSESGSTRIFDAVDGPNWVQVSTSGISATKTTTLTAAVVAALDELE